MLGSVISHVESLLGRRDVNKSRKGGSFKFKGK